MVYENVALHQSTLAIRSKEEVHHREAGWLAAHMALLCALEKGASLALVDLV